MRRTQRSLRYATRALACLALLTGIAGAEAALATEGSGATQPLEGEVSPTTPDPSHVSLRQRFDPAVVWLTTNLHIKKRAGFEYRRPLKWGKRDLVLGVHGPIVKKRNFGLTLELSF